MKSIEQEIKEKKSIAVMFSGGVDSSLLAKLAHDALGKDAIAITVISPLIPQRETEETKEIAKGIGIEQDTIELNELEDPYFATNSIDRCYRCRTLRNGRVNEWAEKRGIRTIADGLNHDDLNDYRPGIKASTEIWHPFVEYCMGKEEIRNRAKALGLKNWNKPSNACLASRLPYNFGLTRERIDMVEKAEKFLIRIGFKEVRVRCFPFGLASIETNEIEKAISSKENIVSTLRSFGFFFVDLDMEGFQSGKLNRTVTSIDEKHA